MTTVGVIGGTGLYSLENLKNVETKEVETPFGKPSSPITIAELDGVKLLFIARHGIGHTLLPTEVNYRANIYALKQLGATWCIAVGAVGSLKEEIRPGQTLVPDQFIDRTRDRKSTFFGEGLVAHVSFADPVCPVLRDLLFETAAEVCEKRNTVCHNRGTYLCMEGPAFSTRAESHMYRSWGADIIGMTNLTEAKLSREAEIAYSTLALITDYDCWREGTADVDIEEILKILSQNSELAKEVIAKTAPKLKDLEPSKLASEALKVALITAPEKVPAKTKEKLKAILG